MEAAETDGAERERATQSEIETLRATFFDAGKAALEKGERLEALKARFEAALCTMPQAGPIATFRAVAGLSAVVYAPAEAAAVLDPVLEVLGLYEVPAPVPLDDVPAPDLAPAVEALPIWLKQMVLDEARATETPPGLALAQALAIVAGSVQGKLEVEIDTGYREGLGIYIAPTAPTGHRKTQVQQAMAGPYIAWEMEKAEELAPEIERLRSERATFEAKIHSLRAQAGKAKPGQFENLKEEIAQLEANLPELPHAPQLWCQDVTAEKLGSIMAANNDRQTVICDEGGGFFENLAGRYSNGVPNFELFLKAYSGSCYRVDRAGRPSVWMQRPSLAILLNPQPQVLQGLTEKPGFRGRGLLARFLYILCDSSLGWRTGNTVPVPAATLRDYNRHLRMLLDLVPEEHDGKPLPHLIRLSSAARNQHRRFFQAIETQMRPGGRLADLQDLGAKFPGMGARIAAILHCASEITFGCPCRSEISGDTMTKALTLTSILVDHSIAAFDLMTAQPQLECARRIWACVLRQQTTTFSARAIFQSLKGSYPRTSDLEGGFDVLLERFYISELDQPADAPRRGRPSRMFTVSPVLAREWK